MIIGLDVGGTHTDVVLLDKGGLIRDIKVPTDESDLFNTVLSGIERITSGIRPKAIDRIVLSTTLTTNAIVQGNTPEIGMVVLSGPGIDPEAFRTHEHYYVVGGAIDHRGREIKPIDFDGLKAVAIKLRDAGIRHVGVVGKFSARNPIHEQKVRDFLKKYFRRVFLGHWVSGSLNFPRRIATTFLNASVYSTHKRFFKAVKSTLEDMGLRIPIHLLKADGGTMIFAASLKHPGQTILSGPAASVMGAIPFSRENEEAIVLDIGGTTTDIGIIINQVPVLEPLGIELAGYKTLIRALKTYSVGLGADSAVKVAEGSLVIGPERMGPAMAFGGPAPTTTDALRVLGKIDEGNLEKAATGIRSVAEKLGLSVAEAASRIYDTFCTEVLRHARILVDNINSKPFYTVREYWEGYTVNPNRILVLGSPAKSFASGLEKTSGIPASVVPKWSVANAIGAAFARTTCEVTLFADTQRGILTAPEEEFFEKIDSSFSREDAERKAVKLLKRKAIGRGALKHDLETEIIENFQFNMVRGFSAAGRNIRVKAQVKPGLIHGYEVISRKLMDEMDLSA